MKYYWLFILLIFCTLGGCQPLPILCLLNFADYHKTYHFDFPVEELKNRIIASYSYDESLFAINFGKVLIENEEVNGKYRRSVDIWLDKRNWEQFKSEIRQNTGDTLNLIIGKLHSGKQKIQLQVIVQGTEGHSSLTIHGLRYQQQKACRKSEEYYLKVLPERIEKRFIRLLE